MGSQSSSSSFTWLKILFLVVLAGGALWWGVRALALSKPESQANRGGGGGPRPATVVVAPVKMLEVQETHRVVGTLRAASRADVAAREDGAVAEVLADEGDSVRQGDVLVRLDRSRLDAQLAQERANVTVASALVSQREAERARANTDLRMKEALFRKEAISQSELLDAERTAKVGAALEQSARDALTAAQAAVTLLEVRYQDLDIKAPFDGRVVARHAEPGEWVRAGDSIMTLISAKLEAWLQVPERFAGKAIDRPLDIIVTGTGASLQASGLRPVPDSDSRTRVVSMIAPLDANSPALVPGLSVHAQLPVSPKSPHLAVPNDAIARSYAGPGVFRPKPAAGGPPVAERVPVQILFEREGMTLFKSDLLAEGDLVVTEGNERLFPNTPLLFEKPAAPVTSTLP